MKVVFFGTPAFAVPSLDAVLAESEIAAVVTQPDRPRGRGLAVEPTPASRNRRRTSSRSTCGSRSRCGTPRVRRGPAGRLPRRGSLRRGGVRPLPAGASARDAAPRRHQPAPVASAALPRSGAHPAGAGGRRPRRPACPRCCNSPTRWTPAILSCSVPSRSSRRTRRGRWKPRLARDGAQPAGGGRDAPPGRWTGVSRIPKIPRWRTFGPWMPTREEALIRWGDPAERIVNRVRAFDPWPVAHTLRDGEELRVWRASARPRPEYGADMLPGTVLALPNGDDAPLLVAAGDGVVGIDEVQPASGRRMPAAAYLRGRPLSSGAVLGVNTAVDPSPD